MGEHSPLAGMLRELDGWAIEPSPAALVMDDPRHKLAETSFESQHLRKETFVSTLAHELRQPLSAMVAAVEVMRHAPDDVALKRATDVMRRQLGQMSRVVEDLVDATPWARGKVTLHMRRVDLRDVIRDAALDVAAAVTARGHELVVANASEPLWADADPQRLHQVLSNLLRNAVKYTEPGGPILLAARGNRGDGHPARQRHRTWDRTRRARAYLRSVLTGAAA